MAHQFSKFVVTLLVIFLVTLIGKPLSAQTRAAHKRNQTDIRLTLHTAKKRYRVGEPIDVLAYLENRGNKSYYVGNTLAGFWGTLELHEMQLTILNKNNKPAPIGRGGGSWIWKPNTTTAEKITQAYNQLRPATIWGLKEQIPITLPAGRYSMTATYREIEALSWTELDRKALTIPVWMQPLTSNTVVIVVSH